MLARRSTITHPLAGPIELPLLVPAFSSKGFGFGSTGRGRDKHEFSEIAYELADFGSRPSCSVMISAYDLHFSHFDAPKLGSKRPEMHLRNSRLVIVDSGGYELVSDFDSSEPMTFAYAPRDGFGPEEYESVLQRLVSLSRPLPLVITNFDYGARGQVITLQIKLGRALFKKFPGCMNNFIIKPWTQSSKLVDPSKMTDTDFADLRGFDIIGVTEKELGKDIFERIKRIAKLRQRLDNAKVNAPIHIWGGLDPIMTPLYFFAGAEIFDGVSWLRYAYKDGVAMNRECYAVVSQIGVTASRQLNHVYASLDNLTALNNLTIALQQWVDFEGKKFDMFHLQVRDYLKRSYDIMTSKLDELKGGV
jgi:hypothetical protein